MFLLLSLFIPMKAYQIVYGKSLMSVLALSFLGVMAVFLLLSYVFSLLGVESFQVMIKLLETIPYLHYIESAEFGDVLHVLLKIIFLFATLSFLLSIWSWIWSNVFAALEELNFWEHFKLASVFLYSVFFYSLLLFLLSHLIEFNTMLLLPFFLFLWVVFYYSSAFNITLLGSLMALLINFIILLLFAGVFYGVYLILNESSVEQDLKDNFDGAIERISD